MKALTTFYGYVRIHRHLASLLMILLVFGISMEPSVADETTERADGILVEDAIVTPVKTGKTAHLRFKVTNLRSEGVTLQAVRSKISGAQKMTMNVPGTGTHVVSGLVILRDETLNLASSHIRVELQDVVKTIEPNSTIEFELMFQRFKTTAKAHAH